LIRACFYFTAVTKTLKEKKCRRAADAFVVIMDDDESVRRALKRLLKSSNFRVEVFASARDFLDFAHLRETSCLILDVRMPGMDGLELQRQLVTSHHIPIIFITGHGMKTRESEPCGQAPLASWRSHSARKPCLAPRTRRLRMTNIELSNLG
jgi:CheY-like chemotaxis protein